MAKHARGAERERLVGQATTLFKQLVGAKIPVEVSYRLLAKRFPLRVIADATGRKWMTVQTACSRPVQTTAGVGRRNLHPDGRETACRPDMWELDDRTAA